MAYKTPGTYVRDLTPPQPADPVLETALPAFIGYTEKLKDSDGNPLIWVPTRIRDLDHFEQIFGGNHRPSGYEIVVDPNKDNEIISAKPADRYFLHESLQQYFDNGGGDCFIVAIGSYGDTVTLGSPEGPGSGGFLRGLKTLEKVPEVTLILFPDAVELFSPGELGQLQMATMTHCAAMKNRFMVADLMELGSKKESVEAFRDHTGINYLKYGGAFYPWLYSTYNHTFRYRELRVFNQSGETIDDYSIFSSDTDGETAAKHRKMVEDILAAEKHMIDLIAGIRVPVITRESIDQLSEYWEQLLALPFFGDSEDEGKLHWDAVRFLADLALVMKRLENSLSDPLEEIIFDKKSGGVFRDQIELLISLLKAGSDHHHLFVHKTHDEIDALFAELNGTNWISVAMVKDIQAFTEWSQVEQDEGKVLFSAFIARISASEAYFQNEFLGLVQSALSLETAAEEILFSGHPFFAEVIRRLSLEMKKLPPSGAVTGVMARTDRQRGVWKAPANEALEATLGPVIVFDDYDQETFNVHHTGKSVNIIRALRGRGVRIWGSRTLDGNSNEWRYIPVTRYFAFVEDFVSQVAEPYVFESNDANTWMQLRLQLNNFFTTHWRSGALAGTSTDEAFFVAVGLGETMTAQDILEGRMIVEIGLAVARPAEFIIVRYICHMQES